MGDLLPAELSQRLQAVLHHVPAQAEVARHLGDRPTLADGEGNLRRTLDRAAAHDLVDPPERALDLEGLIRARFYVRRPELLFAVLGIALLRRALSDFADAPARSEYRAERGRSLGIGGKRGGPAVLPLEDAQQDAGDGIAKRLPSNLALPEGAGDGLD